MRFLPSASVAPAQGVPPRLPLTCFFIHDTVWSVESSISVWLASEHESKIHTEDGGRLAAILAPLMPLCCSRPSNYSSSTHNNSTFQFSVPVFESWCLCPVSREENGKSDQAVGPRWCCGASADRVTAFLLYAAEGERKKGGGVMAQEESAPTDRYSHLRASMVSADPGLKIL